MKEESNHAWSLWASEVILCGQSKHEMDPQMPVNLSQESFKV